MRRSRPYLMAELLREPLYFALGFRTLTLRCHSMTQTRSQRAIFRISQVPTATRIEAQPPPCSTRVDKASDRLQKLLMAIRRSHPMSAQFFAPRHPLHLESDRHPLHHLRPNLAVNDPITTSLMNLLVVSVFLLSLLLQVGVGHHHRSVALLRLKHYKMIRRMK